MIHHFLVHTPLHLSMAIGLSSRLSDEWHVRMIAFRDWNQPRGVAEALEAILGSNTSYIEVEGIWRASNTWSRWSRYRRGLTEARALPEMSNCDTIFFANDSTPAGQWLLLEAHSLGTRIVRLEDGLADYIAGGPPHHGVMRGGLGRIVFGPWFRSYATFGESVPVDEYWVHRPDLLNCPRTTPTGYVNSPLSEPAVQEFWRQLHPEIDAIQGARSLVLLPYLDDDGRALRLVAYVREYLPTAVIKHHPRSTALLATDTEVPREVPAEALALMAPRSPVYQLGESSTVLFLAAAGCQRVTQVEVPGHFLSTGARKICRDLNVPITTLGHLSERL